MYNSEYKKISKFLSLILRHQPETIGLSLDRNGWAEITDLIQKSNDYGIKFDLIILKKIVATNDKKRFAFSRDFKKIRANQGHSINVNLGFMNHEPPEFLFHGTAMKSVQSIKLTGLEKRSRQHVHLSKDLETAIKVGQRHGKPYIYKVKAKEMYDSGFKFYISDNGVWLTDQVPVKYLIEYE